MRHVEHALSLLQAHETWFAEEPRGEPLKYNPSENQQILSEMGLCLTHNDKKEQKVAEKKPQISQLPSRWGNRRVLRSRF